jgi:hypothetical protein
MAQPGSKGGKIHPSKRHNNPMVYKSGKPRLRTLNLKQLEELKNKTQGNKNVAKIEREILKRSK